jgi:dTDP-4-dehydrorhamnose 3,5-epimerase/reductase
MKITKTNIEDVIIIEPEILGDNRGWFSESYSKKKFKSIGIDIEFLQDNHSMTEKKGTLRGLHFQINSASQTKLIRCTKGKILDVVVDLRIGSPTYKNWISMELSSKNKRQIFIPKGFAHGFLTLTDSVEVQYKVDKYFDKSFDRSLRYDDPEIGINWGIKEPILSKKDSEAPILKFSDVDFKIKIMITGASGQLGYDVVNKLRKLCFDVISPDKNEFDLLNSHQVKNYILKEKPDVIIHCAAYTNVDKAEDEKDLAYKINVEGTKNIVNIAKKTKSKIVFISSDYVFEGSNEFAYTEKDSTKPLNYYGYTKECGEIIVRDNIERHFIIRTSWLYGSNGNNFVKTMLELSKNKKEISVVSDQIGAPTYTEDLADLISRLVQTSKYGTYNGVNEGYCSRFEFAEKIFELSNIDIDLKKVKSIDFLSKAKRPLNSMLSTEKLAEFNITKLPHWENALLRYIKEIKSKKG